MPIIVPPTYALLCTPEEAKAQLGKTSGVDDGELLDYCRAVTAPIEHMCGAILPVNVTDEQHTVNGDTLVLNADRVVSVTSLTGYSGSSAQTYTQVATPDLNTGYSFILQPSSGLVRLISGRWAGTVWVTYVAGMATVPANINLAARIIVANLWETQQGGAGLPPVYGEEYDPAAAASPADIPIPPRARMLLEPYRRAPRVA